VLLPRGERSRRPDDRHECYGQGGRHRQTLHPRTETRPPV
jgi:hypothetical protein